MKYEYRAIVKNVVDGDTVDLKVILVDHVGDVGFRRFINHYDAIVDRFRLAEVDTPERGQPRWHEARNFVLDRIPPDSRVRIETFHPTKRDPSDKYGRWLATIFYQGEDGVEHNLNQELLESGLAERYRLR